MVTTMMLERCLAQSSESAMSDRGVVGIDATSSHLWCQVKSGRPIMRVDSDNRLRHGNWTAAKTRIYIGDITEAILRCFQAHEPPTLTEPPNFDQQSWKMVVTGSTLRLEITSRSYWGFGLFDSCFLNELRIEGPLDRRARFIFDLVAALGRNPWEPTFSLMWKRATKSGLGEHRRAWEGLITHAREEMDEEVHTYLGRAENIRKEFDRFEEEEHKNWNRGDAEQCLKDANHHISIARAALHDNNSAGFERAIARAEAAIIEADPTTEVARTPFQEADELLIEEIETLDEEILEERVILHTELPEEVKTTSHEIEAIQTEGVTADDLMSDEEIVDDVPFVDLTESE